MEKTINIDGKPVRFKCTAGTLIRYRNQYNREFIADVAKLKDIKKEKYESLSLDPFDNIVYIMAKTADDSIPDMLTWLDGFDYFSIVDVFIKLQDIIIASLKAKNSSAPPNHPAGKRRRHR